MSKRVLVNLDLGGNELKNFLVDVLSSDPGSPADGRLWYNSTDDVLRVQANGVTVDLGTLSTESVQDIVGAMTTGNTETGITVTYQDSDGTVDFELSDEYLQDVVGAMTVGGTETGITVSYDDTNARLDFVVGVLNSLPAPTGSLSLNSQKITNLADGTAATDAVNLGQLNSVSSGIDWKASVRAATTAAGTLASSFENGDTIDGGSVTLATGDRILIKDQASGAENGIYTVNASGAPTRATDADASAEVTGGLAVWVNEGTTNGDTGWVLTTNDAITLGSTALVFTQFSGLGQVTAGNALTKTGNTLDVAPGSGLEISSDTIRIAAAAAGAGLTGGAGSALAVGAGTGITVNADDVAINPAVTVRGFSQAITGGATSEVITHNMGTKKLIGPTLVNNASPYDVVDVTVEATTTNTITLRSDAANLPANYVFSCGFLA